MNPALSTVLRLALAALLVVLAAAPPGCSRDVAPRDQPLRVVVTVPPLAGLARGVVPPGSRVTALIQPGRSEHGYEFTPQDVAALAEADLVVYVGLGLEPKVEQFLRERPSTRRQVVVFADAVGIEAGDHAHAHDHQHGPECDHGPVDVHLWLDPVLVGRLVPTLRDATAEALRQRGSLDASAQRELDARATDLAARIAALEGELGKALEPIKGKSIVTHHDAWSRLAERYGLKVASVIRAVEGGEPTPDAIAKSVEAIRQQGVRGVFVEPQFSPAAARRIADAAGVRLGTLDPLGDGDWFALMRANAKALVETLSPR